MDGRSHREESPDGFRIKERPLGVLLCWDADLFQGVSREEGMTSLVLLTRPVERRLEHPEIPLNRVGSNETPRQPPAAAPYDVLVNPIWRQLGDRLVMSEELGQVTASLP